MIDRLRRSIRFEDLLLAAWLVLAEPLLTPADPVAAAAPSVLEGLLGLAGLAGFAICIGARSAPGVVSGLTAGGDIAWAIGPLFGAFALVLDSTGANLGLGDAEPLVILLLIGLALLSRFRLPALDGPTRRGLVTPFVLISAGGFGSFLAGLRDVFDLRHLATTFDTGGGLALSLFEVVLVLLGILVFYLMLVFAPRQVAEKEGSAGTWAIRFGVFVASLAVGATWVGIVRP